MQKYAKYTPITGTHSLYTFYLYSTSLVVFTKKKKERKNYIYIKIHNILITICESIFSLSLFLLFNTSCDTTHKRAHEKKTSVAEEQRGSKMIVKGARESIRVASAV